MSAHGILIRKGATVFTIEPTDSLANAAKSLTNHGIGALVVTDAEGHTVGIISERDIVRALGEKESAAFETPVAEIMTRKVVFCSRHDKLVDLMQRMTEGKFRHLPVVAYPVDSGSSRCSVSRGRPREVARTHTRWPGRARFPNSRRHFLTKRAALRSYSNGAGRTASSALAAASAARRF